jgi:hypothetical protein
MSKENLVEHKSPQEIPDLYVVDPTAAFQLEGSIDSEVVTDLRRSVPVWRKRSWWILVAVLTVLFVFLILIARSGHNSPAASPSTDGQGIYALSCLSSNYCMGLNTTHAYTWNGVSWSSGTKVDFNDVSTSGGESPVGLGSVSCSSKSFCGATDQTGYAYTYTSPFSN